ncbi:hypothetical protein LKD73_18380, partial [Fusicatenibacter sp. CLA-AA-H241]|nr:hypothetical protein [Oliverpabstia intestinalis]
MKEYKLQKDLTIAKLKANKFSFKELNTYILTVPLYFYKSSKHKKYATVQMLICINLNESDYEFEIIDENNNMYTLILSILVYTLFSRMFDLMQPPAVKHS